MQNPNQNQNKPQSPSTSPSLTPKESRTLYTLLATCAFSLFFILSLSSSNILTSPPTPSSSSSSSPLDPSLFLNTSLSSSSPPPPSIAYLISGGRGDTDRILRLLLATYHPRNLYLLHLDLTAPQPDRHRLALAIQSLPLFRAANNVHVFGKPDFAYPRGSSSISSMLHGASVLLRLSSTWDWFINLSAHHYPLLTQDDLLHILSFVPKDLNFVNHTSYFGGREYGRLKPIVVDPGLYLSEESEMFYATQKRDLPNAYRLHTGSSSSVISRKFIEFCILGSDNLPRTFLMYLSNTLSSLPNYFPTILCNSPKYNSTIVNHSLQYAFLDVKQEPRLLKSSDFDNMIESGAAFATPFLVEDTVLDRIDREVLSRSPGEPVPGGWCLGEPNATCAVWGNADVLRPGPGARRLEKLIVELFSNGTYRSHQCIVD